MQHLLSKALLRFTAHIHHLCYSQPHLKHLALNLGKWGAKRFKEVNLAPLLCMGAVTDLTQCLFTSGCACSNNLNRSRCLEETCFIFKLEQPPREHRNADMTWLHEAKLTFCTSLLFYHNSCLSSRGGSRSRWYKFNDNVVEEFDMNDETLEYECFGGEYRPKVYDQCMSRFLCPDTRLNCIITKPFFERCHALFFL